MKMIFLLLFPIFIYSQTNFSKIDSLDFKKQVENVLSDTGKNFSFYKYKTADGTKIIAYKNNNNSEDKIMFFYTVYEGFFTFKSITGNLTTLFPVWKKVADPNSKQDKLEKDKSDFISGFAINQLEPNYWMIRF